MSRDQKISLFSACVFYVLTITGFFFFSLTLIILVFLGFSLSIVYFASLCYRVKQDYTGAEHLQQEIGILTADKEQMKKDYEALLKEKDEELDIRQEAIDNITSDLDKATKEQLSQGERVREILKQPQYKPLPVEKQIVIIYAAEKKYLLNVPVEKILEFESELFSYIEGKDPSVFSDIREKRELNPEIEEKLKNVIEDFKKSKGYEV